MKAFVEPTYGPCYGGVQPFKVVLREGNQQFTLTLDRPKDEADWMARMFNKAMRRHDARRDKRRTR